MSSFLINMARRGAGLPTTTLQAPPPVPFGAEVGTPADATTATSETSRDFAMAEPDVPGNTATHRVMQFASPRPQSPGLPGSAGLPPAPEAARVAALPGRDAVTQAPWRAGSSEQVESSLEVSIHPTPAIQRLSGTAPSIPRQPAAGEPAPTSRTPSLDPLPAPLELPKRLGPAVPPYLTARQDVTERVVERNLHTPSSLVLQEPGHQQDMALPERASAPPQVEAQPWHETALSMPMIRPAPEASHTVMDFPRGSASPTPSAPLPIHVRIGRVEVRATPASTPAPARPSAPAAIGFDAYYRLRTYRS